MDSFGHAALVTQLSYVRGSSGAVFASRTDSLLDFPARVLISRSFFIASSPNPVGIVLGLRHVFKVYLILSVVFAVKRSNQSVELTATRFVFTLSMTRVLSLRAMLVLGGGSSLLSR